MLKASMIIPILLISLVPSAFAQEIPVNVNNTEPCFLNYTAGSDILQNCGFGDDWLATTLLPWEWITGGNFSLVFVSVFVMISYIKYHKVVYPMLIGIMFLPVSFFVFPETFLTWAIVMVGLAVGILIWYVYIKQTKEY